MTAISPAKATNHIFQKGAPIPKTTDSGTVAGTSRSEKGGTSGDGFLIVIALPSSRDWCPRSSPESGSARARPSDDWPRPPGRSHAPRRQAAGTAPGPDDPGTAPPDPVG